MVYFQKAIPIPKCHKILIQEITATICEAKCKYWVGCVARCLKENNYVLDIYVINILE